MTKVSLVLLLALAACGQPVEETALAPAAAPQAEPAPALQPLGPGDAELVEGELACSFSAAPGSEPLLLGRGHVDTAPPSAVLRLADGPHALPGQARGGFAVLERGTTFAGDGLTAQITRVADIPTEDESVQAEAVLTFIAADGARRTYDGVWTCGP